MSIPILIEKLMNENIVEYGRIEFKGIAFDSK